MYALQSSALAYTCGRTAWATQLAVCLTEPLVAVHGYSVTAQWKGARPMLPDGPPVFGASGRECPLYVARLGVVRMR